MNDHYTELSPVGKILGYRNQGAEVRVAWLVIIASETLWEYGLNASTMFVFVSLELVSDKMLLERNGSQRRCHPSHFKLIERKRKIK